MTPVLVWLLAHGATVWRLSLAVFVLAGLARAWLRPRLAARRGARAARRQLGPPGELPSGAVSGVRVTLAGRLQLAGNDRLALRVGDAAVLLDGPLEVLAGAREAWPGRLGRVEHGVARSLAAGDAARVSGVLAEEASDDAASYRAPAKHWRLGGPIGAAAAGAPRVTGPGGPVLLASALAGGLGFLAVFGLGGEIAMTVGAGEMARFRIGELGPPPVAIALAAATPFRRADALEALVVVLDARRDPDGGALEERARLHQRRGELAAVAALWIDHGQPERGAALAERTGNHLLAAHGWYAAGDFNRAADAWERAAPFGAEGGYPRDEAELRFGVGVLLFANRLDGAAHAARRLAAALREHPAGNEHLRRWYASRARTATCLADALDARRGAASGWQALHAVLDGTLPPACSILRVDLFEGAERIRAIRALPPLARDEWDVPLRWIDVLAAEADPSFTIGNPPWHEGWIEPTNRPAEPLAAPAFGDATRALIVPNEGLAALALPGIDEHVAETVDPAVDLGEPGRTVWMQATASAALFAVLGGDTLRAQVLARRVQRAIGASPPAGGKRVADSTFWYAVEVQGLVALASGDATLEDAWTHLAGDAMRPLASFHRGGDVEQVSTSLAERPAPDEAELEAWSLAGHGDGDGLAHWLRRAVAQPGTFLRFGAPLLETGREEVGRWVVWGYHPTSGFRPTEEVVHLANLTAAAEAIYGARAPASLRERTRRFREAILRRETTVPLAVLERL